MFKMKKAIWFRNKHLYYLVEYMLHGNKYKERFKLISRIIGKNKKVLDLGCGLCTLYYYLDSSNKYEGWELNEYFVKVCRKKGIDIKLKSCLDFKDFPAVDVIILSDILHHISPKQRLLMTNSLFYSKQLIVCEGFHDSNLKFHYFIRRLTKKLKLEGVIGESDGINDSDNIYVRSKLNLINFLTSYGDCTISEFGRELIAVF